MKRMECNCIHACVHAHGCVFMRACMRSSERRRWFAPQLQPMPCTRYPAPRTLSSQFSVFSFLLLVCRCAACLRVLCSSSSVCSAARRSMGAQ